MADYLPSDSNPSDRGLVKIKGFGIGNLDYPDLRQLTIKEIVLGENILTPGLQTAITFQNDIYQPSGKWFDRMKGQPVRFSLEREWFNGNYTLAVNDGSQIAYRLDNRSFKPVNTAAVEEFTLHACHESLLNDARALVSKSWKCTSPSDIVKKALECAGVGDTSGVEDSDPQRDYIAENIHPFQVINQQGNVALKNNTPDFVHFMTYGWDGGSTPKHHFKSVKSLCGAGSIWEYKYADTGQGRDGNQVKGEFADGSAIISFEFPCDFDYLTDILNGLENGQNKNTVATLNPFSKSMSKYGEGGAGCGIGGYNYKVAITNMGTAKDQNSCNLDVEQHLLKRQARMSLLDRDRIALRMVVPWNPTLHVGKVIKFTWRNKYDPDTTVYGEGDYLITGLSHVIRMGGFSTTAIDCVSRTVGEGEV